MVLPMYIFGQPVLRKVAEEIDVNNYEGLQELIQNMYETNKKAEGVGLAGPQVNKSLRIFVAMADDDVKRVFINPQILKTKGEKECDEGCLSFPNQFGKVVRPTEVTVEFFGRTGKKEKLKAKDLLAQAICHECDHLEGILFVDKVLPGTLEYVTPE